MHDVLVLGAGATGLACAHELARAGVDVLTLEAAPRPGGAIGTLQVEGYRFEAGPNSVPSSSHTLRELCGALGIAQELIVSRASARRRFLFRRGKLRALPSGPLSLLTTGLLPAGAKARLLLEPLRRRPPTPVDRAEPSFEALMVERLGRQAARTLAGAFVRGVYAAEAAELGAASAFPRLWRLVQEHGGLVRGLIGARKAAARTDPRPPAPGPACRRSDLLSFPTGLGRLVEALAGAIEHRLRCDSPVERVAAAGEGFVVHLADGERLEAAEVVLALPARATAQVAAGLLSGYDLPFLQTLGHASVTVVHLGLAGAPCPEGFGFLVPPDEKGPRALGVLFPARVFEGRAPDGRDVATAIYRSAELGGDDPVEVARADLALALGAAPAVAVSRVLTWQDVIPRYGVGHAARADRLLAAARQGLPGLHLAGNWHGGVSVEDCLTRGRAVARAIVAARGAEVAA